VGCLQLINAILASVDDLDFRLHLRNEIMRAGLIDVLEVNAVEQNEYISVLVNMFLNVHSGLNLDKTVVGVAVCQISCTKVQDEICSYSSKPSAIPILLSIMFC